MSEKVDPIKDLTPEETKVAMVEAFAQAPKS